MMMNIANWMTSFPRDRVDTLGTCGGSTRRSRPATLLRVCALAKRASSAFAKVLSRPGLGRGQLAGEPVEFDRFIQSTRPDGRFGVGLEELVHGGSGRLHVSFVRFGE
jgi:hypothetical protein